MAASVSVRTDLDMPSDSGNLTEIDGASLFALRQTRYESWGGLQIIAPHFAFKLCFRLQAVQANSAATQNADAAAHHPNVSDI